MEAGYKGVIIEQFCGPNKASNKKSYFNSVSCKQQVKIENKLISNFPYIAPKNVSNFLYFFQNYFLFRFIFVKNDSRFILRFLQISVKFLTRILSACFLKLYAYFLYISKKFPSDCA